MSRLTEKAYWNGKYAPGGAVSGAAAVQGPVIAVIKRLLGPRMVERLRHYPDYLLWEVLYAKHLPRRRGARVLDVGSAPGEHLVRLWRSFGYEPYGVEYSEQGVQVNRELFEREGLNPANVIHADFLSTSFQKTYRSYFDIVMSHGLIEHFTDLEPVIAGHVNLLRDGGHLVVSIPNLRGINRALAYFFHREILPLHNLSIMEPDVFNNLFTNERLSPLICRYYGTFSFGIHNTKPDSPKRYLLRLCGRLQQIMNLLFRSAFGARSPEVKYFSPYLIFIGIKKS
jgi:SAM-dependent methyltransferase